MINPQTMLPIECNEAAHRQLEYSREEFARLRIADHKAHETPEETRVHVEKVVREGGEMILKPGIGPSRATSEMCW